MANTIDDTREVVRTAQQLEESAKALRELADADNMCRWLANDPADNFHAVAVRIAECRAALDEIEQQACEALEHEANCARQILASIEALGVIEAPTMRAVA